MMIETKQIGCSDCMSRSRNYYSDILTPEVMESSLSPAQFSAFACHTCGSHITKEGEKQVKIDGYAECSCGRIVDGIMARLLMAPSSVPFLDKKHITSEVWYHTTNVEDWFEAVTDSSERPYVHVGRESAALERAFNCYWDNGQTEAQGDVFMWQLMVSPDAVIANEIIQDEDTWCERVTECSRKHLGGDVQRYLNKWEGTGEISLLIDPKFLIPVQVGKISRGDCSVALTPQFAGAVS